MQVMWVQTMCHSPGLSTRLLVPLCHYSNRATLLQTAAVLCRERAKHTQGHRLCSAVPVLLQAAAVLCFLQA